MKLGSPSLFHLGQVEVGMEDAYQKLSSVLERLSFKIWLKAFWSSVFANSESITSRAQPSYRQCSDDQISPFPSLCK